MLIIHSTELIIKSILETHILKAYTDNKIDLRIYANKMVSFCDFMEEKYNNGDSNSSKKNKQKLDYNLVIYMMHCLSKQQQILEKMGYSFYTFRLKDIIVIDDKYFFCIGPELIMPINNKKVLIFYKPPRKEEKDFSSPELLAMNSIPFKISYKTIYYSFGALAIYCLGNPSTYEHTKLYWFIKRCIGKECGDKECGKEEEEIELRQLLFI
jgi:hypothetical protein